MVVVVEQRGKSGRVDVLDRCPFGESGFSADEALPVETETGLGSWKEQEEAKDDKAMGIYTTARLYTARLEPAVGLILSESTSCACTSPGSPVCTSLRRAGLPRFM